MNTLNILFVDDSEEEKNTFTDSVKVFNSKNKGVCAVNFEVAKDLSEANVKINNLFDGAIIDLRLGDQGDEGNQVIKQIAESYFRIPVAVLTGTPDAVDSDFTYIGTFKKGETEYAELLDRFQEVCDTGVTRIMGGRGAIEERLRKVFEKNILPQIQKWVEYGKKDSGRTERALLRHTLNHLIQLLDDNEDKFFPEEMYLCPPLSDKIRTGSIVKQNDGRRFVVMNPACDLVPRKEGACKTDRILIVEIDSCSSWFPGCSETERSKKSQEKELEKAYKNNKCAYLHCLHKTDFFEGGFLNFRKISSLSIDEFNDSFEKPKVQISPYFVKDMVARFSAYYARQGQPDIDLEVVQTKSSQ